MWIQSPFVRTFALITASMAAGYLSHRCRWVPERAAKWLMTFVVVIGYSVIGFFAIWTTRIEMSSLWLPLFLAGQVTFLALLGIAIGRALTKDPGEVGLFGICSGMGNHGGTMGGFVAFLMFGSEGLGLANIYCLSFTPLMILVLYPIARHYSGRSGGRSLGRLMLRSLFDWRSIGLLLAAGGIVCSVSRLPPPPVIEKWKIIGIGMYVINALAYFSIGLRLRLAYARRVVKLVAALAGVRFVAGLGVCLGMLGLTMLTASPLEGVARKVVLIQAIVPMGVTNVAVANMFDMRPREASILFAANTLTYLVVILPIVLYVLG